MIDLSHLTEEEQEMIMSVLRRDAELKKAEEERVRKLEKILSGGPQTDGKLKYLTGEWFYQAKSLRHTDKIHGSEIILASMKQGKAASLDGSLRVDRSRMSSSRSSDIVAPQKPARCFEAQQMNEAEKENRDSSVCSPRLPRRNPFNRASLIVVEPPENNSDFSQYPESQQKGSTSSDTSTFYLQTESSAATRVSSSPVPVSSEPVLPPPPSRPACESGQTSEDSSVAFRPVPKKRTFLSRRTGNQTESTPGVDAPVGAAAGVVPAPRRSLQQSCPKSPEEKESPPESGAAASNVTSQPVQPSRPAGGRPPTPQRDASQLSSHSSLERRRHSSSEKSDRPAVCSRSNGATRRQTEPGSDEQDHQTQREHPAPNLFSLPTFSMYDKELCSHVENPILPEELSLPQSIVGQDPPISYDLNFIDKSNQPLQKPGQTHVFKLSSQATSPGGDEEDSIAKVLDWFNRSVDSSELLNSDEGPEASKIAEVSTLRGEEPVAKTAGKKESQIKRQMPENDKEFRGSGRRGSKELIEGKVKSNTGEGKLVKEGENRLDENQKAKISHLKSFWEKSNVGPKVLVSKVVTPGDKGQKPAQQSAKHESQILSAPTMHSERGIQNKMASSRSDESKKRLVISPHPKVGSSFHPNDQTHVDNPVPHSPQSRNNDLSHSSDYVKLLSSPQAADRSSEAETSRVAKRNPAVKTADGLESGSFAAVGPKPPPDSTLEMREELLTIVLAPLPDEDPQTRASLDSEKFSWSRSSPYMDYKQSVNDVQITTKAHIYSTATDERKGSEDKSTSPKAKEETSSKDRAHGSHSNTQESTAERIKQLKSFWEQERNRPMFYSGKPKPAEDGKVPRGANQAKLNKRFTKSEFDLRSLGNESDSDEEYADRNLPSFTVVPLNQRIEKVSPTLSASRSQFHTLRDFWDEASSDSKGSFAYDKPKSPKRKEPTGTQLPLLESKGNDTEIYRLASAVEKTRAPAMKSSPSHQSRSKSPLERQTSGSRFQNDGRVSLYVSADPGQQRQQSRRSLKDSSREDKPLKPPSSPRKDIRPPKSRKDGFRVSSGRGNSLRRTTSMFALSAPDEAEASRLRIDVSPVHSHSRKQRLSADKSGASRRSSEEALTPPRARAYVPTDYRHYLGMTDSVHTSLAPAAEDGVSEGKSGCELSLGGPVRASTPVGGEERHSRRDSRAGQRPPWTAYSSSDTGMESSLSSTSESWSSSRKNREKDDEQNPVKKALWRAEIRPKNLAKSLEDITGPLSPRQERRPDPTSELRRISNVSSIPSSSSSLFCDSDHLKNMSKSVPSFLQKEDANGGSDAMFENVSHPARLSMGSSMTNINRSSGMKSVFPLSGSVMTMYSGDFGNVEVQGHIQFSINYIQRLREFHIFVAECGDLAAVEPKRGRSDPYVKSYLVPDKANLGKRKTSVKKKTLNPTFNEILRYRVRMEYLRTQTLILSVWHHDTFGRNSFLGEVDVDLSKWDFDHTQMNYLALKPRATPTLEPSNGRGEMKVAIRFLPQITHSEGKEGPSTGEIHIWVKECKNLPAVRASIDPYVKCFVLPDTSRKSRQKTRVLRRTLDPVFNHTMVYDGIRDVDLMEACVELTVWDRDRLASNLLGGLRLGAGTGRSYGAAVDWMDSSPFEMALWERMIASPNEWVEDVLPLRVLNSAKTAFK